MDERISKMKLEEKAKLLCGYKTMNTYPIEELHIPSLQLSDGPNGVRMEDKNGDSLNGIASSLPATCFPTGVNLASTWDKKLLYKVGQTIGKECNYYNINVILGPAINIKRNPKCGRNFEYYSEDPILSGYLASEFVKGVQSRNVAACLKHFACNNNEKYRFTGDSIVDKRALNEIYLKPFEIAVKKSSPWSIMNSYNKINGIHASENAWLLNETLRDKWGFDGLVMTDWGGIVSRVEGLKNGTDLEMPGMVKHNINSIIEGVNNNSLDEKIVDKSVDRILKLIERTRNYQGEFNFIDNYNFAIEVAKSSGVLLKNNNDILPLNKKQRVAIVGGLFEEMRYQGSGSSLLNPYKLSYHKDSLDKRNINYEYIQGYVASEIEVDEKKENEALEKIKNFDTIVLYVGQNDYVESEGFDRESVTLSNNQLSLLEKIISLKKKLIVVLFGGAMIELPFIDNVDALLYMGLAGEGIGEATTSLLYGEISPSGRLAETWTLSYNDVVFENEFISSPNEVYKESIFVGYRYYNSLDIKVRFPFGFGLSYSKFEYSDFLLKEDDANITIIGKVKNIGNYKSSEVIQVYTSKRNSKIYRPKKELKGFEKFYLDINEEKEIEIVISKEDLMIFNTKDNQFCLENGEYDIIVSKNIDEEIQTLKLNLDGKELEEDDELAKKYYHQLDNLSKLTNEEFSRISNCKIIPYIFNKKPYTFETPIGEFDSFIGKIFKNALCKVGLWQYKKACKMKDGPEKERKKKAGLFVYKLMPNNSIRSLCYSSSGKLPYRVAIALVDFVNEHFFKGIKKLIRTKK